MTCTLTPIAVQQLTHNVWSSLITEKCRGWMAKLSQKDRWINGRTVKQGVGERVHKKKRERDLEV